MSSCATCGTEFADGDNFINGVEGLRCFRCNRSLGPEEKDYGPVEVAQFLGVCVGSYIRHGVTKDELLKLVSDMYEGIVAQAS